jgi:ribosomal protein L17
MRHRYNKLKYLETGVVKKSLVIRNLLTSLIKNWEITTTSKRAKVLKSFADKFFNRAKRIFEKYNDADLQKKLLIRLADMYLTNDGGKYRFGWKRKEQGKLNVKEKFVDLIAPTLKEVNFSTGFVIDYKLWYRKGDGAEEVLVKLNPQLLKNVK